jgi:CBASS immunity sensor of nucleotide second messenger signals/TIR domain-containing protein
MTPLKRATPVPVELFYSYAHADEKLRDELEKHLSLLKRQGFIAGWYDREIGAGREWDREIDTHLDSAGIILLLISPDFMASDYCFDIEVKRAMERHEAGEARVIPVILRRVDWHGAEFGKLQALPRDGKPVTQWSDRDAAFYEIAQGIRKVIEELPRPSLPQVGSASTDLEQSKAIQSRTQAEPGLPDEESRRGLERPATAFLSYAREDAEEVTYLQIQLKVRGVRAWRDVSDLPLGGSNEDEITQAIDHESDAFVLYVTPQCLASDFIWDVEVPAALGRWERDHAFNIVPILRGVTFDELEQHCAGRGLRSLRTFHGVSLPEKATGAADAAFNTQLRQVARRILDATLALRLRRAGADRKYEACLYLRTYAYEPPTDSPDLALDWTELFPSKDELPTEKEWDEILLPALDDVKNALSLKIPGRRLHMFVQAHLPAAFATGFFFPASAHFTLLLEGRHGTWSTAGAASTATPLRYLPFKDSGDPSVAVMEIAIARDTAQAVTQNLPALGISYKQRIRFDLAGGTDYISGVQDAAGALAMSHQVGREFRRLFDKEGVTRVHVFSAMPAALAVMIGHQINAMGAITLYHFTEKDRRYVPVCTLGKQEEAAN